jgi:hypothetical protein
MELPLNTGIDDCLGISSFLFQPRAYRGIRSAGNVDIFSSARFLVFKYLTMATIQISDDSLSLVQDKVILITGI